MEIEIIREQDIKSELARIAAGENIETLFLQFQPIIDLKSDKIKGFEALARMKNEKTWPGSSSGIYSCGRED